DDLLVALVRTDHVDLDDDRLVHRAGNDNAPAFLAPAALVVRLRLPDDRLPCGAWRLAATCLLRAQTARETLCLLLRLGLNGRSFALGLCALSRRGLGFGLSSLRLFRGGLFR